MMLYAPLAVKRLGAAVCVLPAYAAKPTRRERVSRRGPSGAGERAARALTQERAERTLRRLQAGRTAAARGRPGERLPSCAHPRGLPGHGTPSTASRSAGHTARRVKDRSTYPGSAATHEGRGGTLPPHGAPAHARAASARAEVRLTRPLARAGVQTTVAVLLVRAARPSLDAGALRQYIAKPGKESGKATEG